MTSDAAENDDFIACWNEILTPKWIRFRHLLSGDGKLHSDVAIPRFDIRPGSRVLDFGCGFGETSLEIGRLVGPLGEVLELDCAAAFLEIANRERDEAGLRNVRYELGDAQVHPLRMNSYDVAFARFGVMFFESAMRALTITHTLPPGTSARCTQSRGKRLPTMKAAAFSLAQGGRYAKDAHGRGKMFCRWGE